VIIIEETKTHANDHTNRDQDDHTAQCSREHSNLLTPARQQEFCQMAFHCGNDEKSVKRLLLKQPRGSRRDSQDQSLARVSVSSTEA
jgi:hypothetical protein